MKKRMTTLVCLLLMMVLLAACGSKAPQEATVPGTTVPESTISETAAPVTTEATVPPAAEDHIIPTPYGDLHFPGDWAPFLKTEIGTDPFTVTFYAVLDTRPEPQRLFAIAFGGKAQDAAAAVKTAEGYAAVAVEYVDFVPDETWTDRDINIVFTMQDALNHIMENLPLEDSDVLTVPAATKPASSNKQESSNKPASSNKQESSSTQETTGKQEPSTQEPAGNQDQTTPDAPQPPAYDEEDMAVDTPYMELHYPAMWADTLSMKVNESGVYSVGYYAAIGSHGDQHLFTVYFGGQNGTLLRTIKAEDGQKVEIRIDVPELSLDGSWTDEEKTIAFAMQEDLNYLLGRMD